jgi:hypothetical protein
VFAAPASPPATKALDPDLFSHLSLRHAVYAALLHFGFETAGFIECMKDKKAGKARIVSYLANFI